MAKITNDFQCTQCGNYSIVIKTKTVRRKKRGLFFTWMNYGPPVEIEIFECQRCGWKKPDLDPNNYMVVDRR